MLPRIGSSKLISTWLAITLVASVIAMLDGGFVASWTALAPERVWHGQVWRLFTWIFVDSGPWSIILTCATIYKFGGELAHRWGDRRLRRFMLQLLLGGAVLSCLLALVSDYAWQMYHFGGWAVSDALVIAWARQYPNSSIRVYGFLELSGKALVAVTVGVTLLIAVSSHPLLLLPEIVACVGAALYPRGWLENS